MGPDVPGVYAFTAVIADRWHRVCRDGIPVFPAFEPALWQGVLSLYKVVLHDEIVGLASVFNADLASRTAWVEALIGPGLETRLPVARVFEELSRISRQRWQLRKLYVSHYGFEAPPLSSSTLDWDIEARLRDAVLHENFYWDLVISAIWLDRRS